MSNQMIPFEQAQLPAFLQGQVDPNLAKQMNMAAAHGAGGSAAPNRISIKQGRFRLIVNGTETQVIAKPALEVIILRVNDGVNKNFFSKEYNPNEEAERPDCSSDDGITPRLDSPAPQCNNCAQCPQNQYGSKVSRMSGAKIKACTDSKRFAIVPAGHPDGDPYQVSVPPASLKDFGAYLRQLASLPQAVPYNAVVTEVSFDLKADHPKLLFRPVRYLTADEYTLVAKRYDEEQVKFVAGMAESQPEPAAQQNLIATAQTNDQQQQQQQQVQQTHIQHQMQTQVQQQVEQEATGAWGGQQVQQQQQVQESAGDWGGQQTNAQAQQTQVQRPTGPVHPSGREVGKPPAGKTRRNSAEVAEDDAYFAAQNGGQGQQQQQQTQVQQQQTQVQQTHVQQAAASPFDADSPFAGAPGIQPQHQTQVAATAPVVSDPALAGVFGGTGWDD